MRGNCEFNNCSCKKFKRNKKLDSSKTICKLCNHGKCWHKKIKKMDRSQFLSCRPTARKPIYNYSLPNNIKIFVPILQNDNNIIQNNYCKSVDDLPA